MRVIEHDRKLREFMTTKGVMVQFCFILIFMCLYLDFERQELESQALMQRRLKGEKHSKCKRANRPLFFY